MILGPVFNREVVIAPRRAGIYVGRAAYVSALLVLMSTAWLVLTGTQLVRDVGDLARFGTVLFQILAPLQAAVAMFFSAMLSASAVAQEKDRRTLVLLLLTHLSNSELVLGKLLASLLQMLVMLTAALPVFMLAALWGGVSFGQIARVFAVTLASVVACGSLGSTLALWREKTFQSPGDDGAGAGALAGGGRDRGGRRAGEQLGRHLLHGLGRRHQPLAAILAATHPYVQAQPALGLAGDAGSSVPPRGSGDRAGGRRRGGGDGPRVERLARSPTALG